MHVSAPKWLVGGYVLAYSTAQITFGLVTNFHVAVNDVLGLMSVADGINWTRPETLHNGFFPFAMPAILAMLPDGIVVPAGGLLSVAFGALALLATYSAAGRLAGAWWGVVAAVLVSIDPLFVTYVASAGPDVIALGLAMSGLAMYAHEDARLPHEPRVWMIVGSGVLFGAAGLFRYHVALLGVCLLAWSVTRDWHRWRTVAAATAGVLLGFLPQVVVNVLGGFGPLESDSAFTMYQSVVPIDWHATSAIDPAQYASPVAVITGQPFSFTSAYLTSLTRFTIPIALVATALLIHRARRSSTLMLSILVGVVAYAVIVSTGHSPRGLLPVVPLVAIAIAVISQRAFEISAEYALAWQRLCAVIALLGFAVALPAVMQDAAIADGRLNAAQARAGVEADVLDSGAVSDAGQILTNDFDLYLTDLPGTNPETIGGWTNISRNGRVPHTDVDLTSVTAFYCSAHERGIRMVLWSPGSVPGLDPDLEAAFNGTWRTPLLERAGTMGTYHATLLRDRGYDCP